MLKIILADNQAIFRAGAAKVLAVEDDFRIVAQCDTLEKFLGAVDTFRGSIVIFSSAMKPDYTALLNQIKAAKSKAIVVAEMSDNVRQFLTNGILGVVYRNIGGPALVECVRKASRGEVWVQDAQILEEDSENDMVGARVRDRLTDKELKIVALIVQGYKNKEIANRLGTTEQVIKNYLRNVYDKIGVSDRLELALFTIHHRILAEAAAAITGGTNVSLPN